MLSSMYCPFTFATQPAVFACYAGNGCDATCGYSYEQMDSPKGAEVFRSSIQHFVSRAEAASSNIYTITNICNEFGFQRRRLYDVINVLAAAGCCKKTNVDTVKWLGLSTVGNALDLMKKNCDGSHLSNIESLFPNGKSISIGDLTTAFLMSFYMMNTDSIDLKQVSNMLSHENKRFKTTLCKLYQVAHILEAASIIERSSVPGEMRILISPPKNLNSQKSSSDEAFSVDSLLNRPVQKHESQPTNPSSPVSFPGFHEKSGAFLLPLEL